MRNLSLLEFLFFQRDDRRRATHNEVERRRRDKINNWIAKLGKIIPECNGTTSNGANGEAAGKANYETQVFFKLNFDALSLVITFFEIM